MALSVIVYPGDGVRTQFNIPFSLGYIKESDVTARVDGEVDGTGNQIYRDLTFLSPEIVDVQGTAVPVGTNIIFERTVVQDELIVDYEDGDIINEENMNTSQKQMIMLVHQVLDGRFAQFQSGFDMGGFVITGLGDPRTPTDAVNRAYVDRVVGPDSKENARIAQEAADTSVSAAASILSMQDDLTTVLNRAVFMSDFCTGVGIESAQIQLFFDALSNTGKSGVVDIAVRSGVRQDLSNYIGTLTFDGDGSITFSGSDGLLLNNANLPAINGIPRIVDAQLFTTAASVGTAFKFIGSKPNSENLVPSIHIDGMLLSGVARNMGWFIGMDMTQVKRSTIVGLKVSGLVPSVNAPGALDASSLFSVTLHDGCNQVEFIAPVLDWGRYGVYVAQYPGEDFSEGVILRGGDVRAHRLGFVAEPAAGAQFQSVGVHYDTTAAGVLFGKDGAVSTDFSRASGNFLLRSSAENYSGTYSAIGMNNSFSHVTDNSVFLPGSPNIDGRVPWSGSVGIAIGSDVDMTKEGRAVVSNNSITGPDTAIHLKTATRVCKGSNLVYAFGNPTGTPILDTGSGNIVS